MQDQEPRDWRKYSAWISFIAGLVASLMTVAVIVYIQFDQKRPYDVWEARYFFITMPIALGGVLFGVLGKDAPRTPGLVLSICVVLLILGDAMSL